MARGGTCAAAQGAMIGFLHPGSPEAGRSLQTCCARDFASLAILKASRSRWKPAGRAANRRSLPQLTQELIQLGVDVLVPTTRPSIEAARAATTTLPIVANDLESDPIASGYVASLARPGSNLTGVFLDAPTLCSKSLQYIDDVAPNVTKVGVLWDVTTGTFQLDAVIGAAKTKSLNPIVMQFRNAAELEPALNRGLTDNPGAIVQLGSPLIRQGAPRIAELLSSRRIPAISQFRTYPDGGGLMSYGPDLSHLYRRVSSQVSRVLRGSRPAELPIERPTKFELVINVKAAKALGLTVPTSLLATADEVIE